MSYPKYPQYKDSGVEWLGNVPASWSKLDGKRLFRQVRERRKTDDLQLSATQKHGVIPQAIFMEENDLKPVLALSGIENFKHVERDDFVISLRSFQGGLEHSEYVGCVSPAYTVLRARKEVEPRYWSNLLKSEPYITALQANTEGIRDGKNISYEQFGAIKLPLPPLPEQQQIAAFLDRECAKMDTLLDKQQALITLLQEKRQALISRAVTKGLGSRVPMKPSNTEWLGDVPAHWKISRVKHATSKIIDCPHETPTLNDDGKYLTIRTADIDEGKIFPEQMRRVDEKEYRKRVRREPVLRSDIVYSREGGRWGHAALVPDDERFCLGQRMMQLRVNGQFLPEYLMWHLNATNVYVQGDVETVGAASPHVNVVTISNYSITAPPLYEQEMIVKHITQTVGGINTLITKAKSAITLIKERRTALISAAVTGKIDVRDYA